MEVKVQKTYSIQLEGQWKSTLMSLRCTIRLMETLHLENKSRETTNGNSTPLTTDLGMESKDYSMVQQCHFKLKDLKVNFLKQLL